MIVELAVTVDLTGASPREVRERFAEALRDAIGKAHAKGEIDTPIAEELWRTIPDPERA